MMRILEGLFGFVVVLVVAFVAIGLFLPSSAHVERSITTSASPAAVYELIDGFGRFNEWLPWASLDPSTEYRYSGPATGVGARMEWHSDDPDVGSGSQAIIGVEPGRSVTSTLDFGSDGVATTKMTLVPVSGGGTRIVWAMDMSFAGNFIGRYFGPFLDRMVGPDYDKGLRQLKQLVEVAPRADAPAISPAPPAEPAPAAESAPPAGSAPPMAPAPAQT